jgi:hypothetical protein
MNKKTYIAPALSVIAVEQVLPIATSMGVNNTPMNDVEGDVKGENDWSFFEE